MRSNNLTWTIQRYGFVYGDRDGHVDSQPEHLQMDGALARRLGIRPSVRTIHQAIDLQAMRRVVSPFSARWSGRR